MSDFLQAARWTDRNDPLPHQDAAWAFAWSCLTDEEKTEFFDTFRAAVESKAGDVPNNWDGICSAAKQAGCNYPELIAAQWALESSFGKHQSGRNNFWGLKGKGSSVKTHEYVNGEVVEISDSFKDFQTIRAGVDYLCAVWYKDATINGVSYKGVNRAIDREEAAFDLQRQGYATDPRYGRKLVDLMNKHSPRPQPTQESVREEVGVWRTKVEALNLSQPDSQTCQAACIGMAVGDRDIRGIRMNLQRLGTAGSPSVMASVIREYSGVNYSYEANATLAQARQWLQTGELLITHGWFTPSGHVLVLDGCTSDRFDVKDPWSQFNEETFRYDLGSKFFDGYYSDLLMYATCVAGTSCQDARNLHKRSVQVDYNRKGMWVHRFRP